MPLLRQPAGKEHPFSMCGGKLPKQLYPELVLSPPQHRQASYDTSCDVFSAALSIFFVCTTVEPFADCATEQAAKQIKAGHRPNAR